MKCSTDFWQGGIRGQFLRLGVVNELKKRLAERMLNAEMDHRLGTAEQEEADNHRNGYGAKTVLTDTGKLELAIPRDRHGRFDPVLIGK